MEKVSALESNAKGFDLKKLAFHAEEFFGCIFLFIFVGLTIFNVILRYGFNYPLPWIEEGVMIAFTWCVFLGTITAFRNGEHVAIDVIVKLFPPLVQKILAIAMDVLILGTNIYMTYMGVVLCSFVGKKVTLVLRLSYVVLDVTIVVSFGLMALFGIYRLVLRAQGKYHEPDEMEKIIQEAEKEAAKMAVK